MVMRQTSLKLPAKAVIELNYQHGIASDSIRRAIRGLEREKCLNVAAGPGGPSTRCGCAAKRPLEENADLSPG